MGMIVRVTFGALIGKEQKPCNARTFANLPCQQFFTLARAPRLASLGTVPVVRTLSRSFRLGGSCVVEISSIPRFCGKLFSHCLLVCLLCFVLFLLCLPLAALKHALLWYSTRAATPREFHPRFPSLPPRPARSCGNSWRTSFAARPPNARRGFGATECGWICHAGRRADIP